MTMLLDNKGQGKVGDALSDGILPNARLSILTSRFSIYGYYALKQQLTGVGNVRLLVPSNHNLDVSGNVEPFRLAGLTGDAADRRFRNSLKIEQ